jgi:hypothetical protein
MRKSYVSPWKSICARWDKLSSGRIKKPAAKAAGKVFATIWRYLKAFKKVWLAIPVVLGSVVLAMHNLTHLPKVVGLNLQTDGVFALQIPRGTAVFAPLAVTLLCLIMMFCSRRTLTPWFVSLVSLALPVVILILNTFPG